MSDVFTMNGFYMESFADNQSGINLSSQEDNIVQCKGFLE